VRLSESGKRYRRFFETKEQAQKFIFETKRNGSIELADLAVEEKHVLGVIRQSQKYEPRLLLEAWRRFESEGTGNGANLTVQQLCEKFLARQIAERRSAQTLADDRWRLNAFSREVGQARAAAVKRSDILGYLEAIPPGTNRRSHYKTLRKLWRWAFDLGHVEHDPMARLKPLDAWGVNNEVLSVELFQRFMRVTQGLEAPREGVQASAKYKPLLPYFVLGGLQGLRTCEMVRERADYPVIEWRDFKWKKKLIVVRDEVAKQTRARDKLRYVPLEAASVKLLRSLADSGPVIQIARRAFQSLRRELCREMRVRWPENCLRNSYATYAQTFRSSGDVARAMGDAEGTVKRFYVQTLEPGVGKNWFNLPADLANS
jgi:site-specific recombinase XerD